MCPDYLSTTRIWIKTLGLWNYKHERILLLLFFASCFHTQNTFTLKVSFDDKIIFILCRLDIKLEFNYYPPQILRTSTWELGSYTKENKQGYTPQGYLCQISSGHVKQTHSACNIKENKNWFKNIWYFMGKICHKSRQEIKVDVF